MKHIIYIVIDLLLTASVIQAQTFSGIGKSFVDQKFNDYKVQQFLMNDVFKISSSKPEYYEFSHVLRDHDKNDGDFLIMMSSYRLNDKTGMVLTSFVGSHEHGTEMTFYHTLHLTSNEVDSLNNAINLALSHLVTLRNSGYENENSHYLLTFNEQIKVDAVYHWSGLYVINLWIHETNRHTISTAKWKDAYSKHLKFMSFKN